MQCAEKCVNMRRFVCRSFNFVRGDDECTLYDLNADLVGGLTLDNDYNYYEVVRQAGQ